MPISINSNTIALEASHNLDLTSESFAKAVQRLSSGLRINSAADDAAGLGVSQTLIEQINGYDQAQRNAQDAVSLLQTAQTGLNETLADLQRMNQLAIQASNGTLSSSDLQNIQLEIQGLLQDIDRVAQQTKYNTKSLLNGSLGAGVTGGGPDITDLQVQAGTAAAHTYKITAMTPATQATITGNATGSSTFTGGGSITITGPTGSSQTFTTFAGETVSNFIQQVNNANLGVTLSNSSGTYKLVSNYYGANGTAGGVTNNSGPSSITTNGTDTDFGNSGAALGLVPNGGGTSTGTATQNANVTLSNGTTTVTVALTGSNDDQFTGTGIAAGISFRVTNPGTSTFVANSDVFTVTQNSGLNFQVGANANTTVGLEIDAQTSMALGVNAVNLTTQTGAESAITPIQDAIDQVTTALTNLGAIQTNLTNSENLAGSQELNMQQANSNIVDANISQETVNFTRDQILLQAGTAVLAQANQEHAGVLGLFNASGPVL
ncbi:MAG TPA: flagellin [Chloroflexota bacterium]|nr:flagellin [Chloroflexota bacterium]